MDTFTMARQLRMSSAQEALKAGTLSRPLALNVLSKNLDPNDPATFCDDSGLLDDAEAVDKIATSCPACHTPIGEYLQKTWTRKSALFDAACLGCGTALNIRVHQYISFEITLGGHVRANDANLEGVIGALPGEIQGWNVSAPEGE